MATAMEKLAEDYGYQLAFLKSDPGLYKIFQQAVSGKWDATRFVAAVKASPWYKKHGEAYRQNAALKTTDPATYRQRLNSQRADIGAMAQAMGASLTYDQITRIADNTILFGWNQNQVRNTLGQYLKPGAMKGEAGSIAHSIRETAYRNGFNITQWQVDNWVKKISMGQDTLEAVQQRYREGYGAKLAPGFEKELKAGMDLYDIASPYMQTMSKTLELNPSDIDLFDPTIRKALGSSTGADGKPGSMSLWEFEQGLRQDRRFMKTKGAQDEVMAVGNKVLQDFGLVGS